MKFNTKATEEKMQKSVNAYESNLSTIRASQANGAIVAKVTFDYYGSATKLTDMASVSVTDPKTLTIVDCPDFESAVRAAAQAAQPGDIVLMSPASAAFDQFKNFMVRGQFFKKLVREL